MVVEEQRLYISCGDETLVEILELQLEGKKPMDTKTFLNGYKEVGGKVLK